MTSRRRRSPAKPAGDIWIGDVVRAWVDLAASAPADRRAVAAALGFEYVPPVSQADPEPVRPTPRSQPASDSQQESSFRPAAVTPPPDTHHATPEADALSLLFELEPVATAAAGPPAWAAVSDVVPDDEPRHLDHQPPLEPLLIPGWTRATLAALCATRVDEGPIDFHRVLDAICRRRPLATLPREPVRTLRRGVQLLVDDNEGFSYYERDVDAIVQTMAAVAGRDRTEVLWFVDVPSRGVRRGRFAKPVSWRPPAPGTPVVAISDFGLVRDDGTRSSGSPAEWEKVAARSRAAGCALLGLVPFAPSRWPARLRRVVRLLRWDRQATAALARRVARGELG